MSSPAAILCRSILAVGVFLVVFGIPAAAQCPSLENDPNAIFKIPLTREVREVPLLPEEGYLSNTHYTNVFFGFGFDLPLTVKGHEIMMPVMPEHQHALLALQYENGQHHGYIMATAKDPRPGTEVNTRDQQEAELRTWAQTGEGFGTPPAFLTPEFMLRAGRFYYSMRHKGADYAAQYWTYANNYVVKVVFSGNDRDFLRKAKAAMAQAKFYCPQDDGTLITKDEKPVPLEGSPYRGPTAPAYFVDLALRDEPGKNIPPGEVRNGVYLNSAAGLEYQLPQAWTVVPAEKEDPPSDERALREYQFLHACSQTLLRVAPPSPDSAKGQEPGPMIVLRALDPNCLTLRTATSLTDKRSLDEVAATLEATGEFGQIATDELLNISDHLFMVFYGTAGGSSRGAVLANRMSQSIFLTRYNKLLLAWSLMAPTAAALQQIPGGVIRFDGSPPIELRSTLRAKK